MINAAMKNTAKALLVSSTLAVTTMASAALPSQWQLDDSHTRVGFSVEHMGFSTVMGHFSDVEGTVQFDLKNPNQAQLNFVIDTDSIDTAWKARDEHLKTDEFFNVEKYPTMSFKSTQVNFINPQQAKVTGDFTLLGQTKPVTLNLTLKKVANSPMTNEPVIGFRATGTIDRTAYGMDAYSQGVTTSVPIQIDGELVEKKAK
ncbi:MAG: polyisoprenoid-binding protein [Psychrobacter sp.]|jgi:polyisoprenoid-binding protein YceI|uniref:YceI family protein n=1 Tax=Psychrobacter namhaensis TaxID=292734 RepID=A0ABW8LBY3_9GAMM|nr:MULTISPECIES: YceI family protein [Psychrobacter]MCD1279441.1 polyisoprenoid-binding protein [Psychrobacter sp. CCUG 69069]MCD6252243.1 polyisoprenoid-binding protein [Psychrobacter sp.]HCN17736.1 polyisoprenoid-binding protein [Psychrobacter sp.]|tara:strand:+ start:1014 stop:1619 length:606 start_codon:yes stop_codon:yes gene_type:complete